MITSIVILAVVIGMAIVFFAERPKSSTTAMASPTLTTSTPKPALCKRGGDLWWAANSGNLILVKTLLKCPNVDINIDTEGEGQRTPLYVASTYGYTEIVRALLKDPRTEVNECECGATPLIGASHYGHLEVVKLLLRCPKTKIGLESGHKGKSAEQWAMDRGHTDIAGLMSEKSRKKLIAESGISC